MKKLLIALLLMLPLQTMAMTAPKLATVFNPETGDRKVVEVNDPHAFDDGYILEVSSGYVESEELLGASVVSDYYKYLSQTISATVTTIPVTSMTTTDGHTLTMSDFGSKVFLTIEPQNLNKKEIVMCTGISSLSFTGCTRGLAFYGTSTASVADNRKTHQSGVAVTISNVHYVYEDLLDKDTNQVMTGDLTLNSNLTATGTIDFSNATSVSVPEPTSNSHASTKFYSDNLAFAGFGTSTQDTAGGGYLTRREDIASSSYDSDAPRLLYAGIATTTRDVATSSIVATDPNGYIKQELIDLSEDLSFTGGVTMASTTVTGTSTFEVAPVFPSPYIPYTQTVDSSHRAGDILTQYDTVYIATTTADSTISSPKTWSGTANNQQLDSIYSYAGAINISTNVTKIRGIRVSVSTLTSSGVMTVKLMGGSHTAPNSGTLLAEKDYNISSTGVKDIEFDTPFIASSTTDNYFFIFEGDGTLDIKESGMLLAGSSGSGVKLYRSNDGGAIWSALYYQGQYTILTESMSQGFLYKAPNYLFDGFVTDNKTIGQNAEIITSGISTVDSAEIGNMYYLDGAGGITKTSNGSNSSVGIANREDEIFIIKGIK